MNRIQESMKEIHATEEMKKNTLQYLKKQQRHRNPHPVWRYVLAAACFCIFLGMAGGYMVYARPVSYISIDINPSIELGVNRFGKVVSADAYNVDGQNILEHVRLKNISYIRAIEKLLGSEGCSAYLTGDSRLFFTVISEDSDKMAAEISADDISRFYGAQTYISDTACREEAHQHDMSFGKYRAYLELSEYDETVTVEDCHGMTMGEISERIETCRGHGGTESGESHWEEEQSHHEGHHGDRH